MEIIVITAFLFIKHRETRYNTHELTLNNKKAFQIASTGQINTKVQLVCIVVVFCSSKLTTLK